MKDRIIEIVELGQPQSLIQRENAHTTELLKTDLLIEELNEQLLQYNVSGQSEQLPQMHGLVTCECGTVYDIDIESRCPYCGN